MAHKVSRFLTYEVARQAIELVRPSIEAMMERGVCKRKHLDIVVLNPLARPDTGTFDEAVLCEQSWEDESQWEHNYRVIARSKVEQTWRTSLPTRLLQQMPHLYQRGDSPFFGSANHDGIMVGASGVESHYDVMFASWVAAAAHALATTAYLKWVTEHPNEDKLD